MSGDPPNGFQRELGILIGEMRDVKARLDRAEEGRGRMYDKIEAIAEDVIEVKGEVAALGIDVNAMKPAVEMVNGMKGKAGGVALVLAALGALGAWFVVAFTDNLKAAIVRFFQ